MDNVINETVSLFLQALVIFPGGLFILALAKRERDQSLHSIMGLPVLQGLPLLLRLVLQVVPLLQATQGQAVEDVLVGLLDQLLEQAQRHDADLWAHMERGRRRTQLPDTHGANRSSFWSLTKNKTKIQLIQINKQTGRLAFGRRRIIYQNLLDGNQ